MPSKYVDNAAIIQVIGSVFNNMEILEDERYCIIEDDFVEQFHKIVFGAIFKIHELGAATLDVHTVSEFLKSRPKSDAIYKANNGEEWLLKAADMASLENFDYHYDKMKKFSLLRAFDNCGVNVRSIFDPDNILDLKLRQEQQEWLDNTPIEDIANIFVRMVDDITTKYVDNAFSEARQAGTGIFELIESFKETPEVGLPLYGDMVNTITRGARLKKFYLRSAPTGTGKALPDYTIIPTPNGFRKVGDIKPGDLLFDEHGKATIVEQIHKQPTDKEIWIVELVDGRVVECCGEHLWEYYENGKKKVAPTEEMALSQLNGIYLPNLCQPADFPPVDTKGYDLRQLGIDFAKDESGALSRMREINLVCASPQQKTEFLEGFFSCPIIMCAYQKEAVDYYCDIILSMGWQKPTQKEMVAKMVWRKRIVEVRGVYKTKRTTSMTCFTVENPTHLFLANDFVITHNTRSMIADACTLACGTYYDPARQEWIENGCHEPVLFITTEQEIGEIQTMMLAFISAVNEEFILNGSYLDQDQEDRIRKAAIILQNSPIYVEELPDFSLQDIENTIKANIKDRNVKYVFHDYIHTSIKILEEITRRSGGVKLREDNILFMLSTKLKDLCNRYGVFILTATQLSGLPLEMACKYPFQELTWG